MTSTTKASAAARKASARFMIKSGHDRRLSPAERERVQKTYQEAYDDNVALNWDRDPYTGLAMESETAPKAIPVEEIPVSQYIRHIMDVTGMEK